MLEERVRAFHTGMGLPKKSYFVMHILRRNGNDEDSNRISLTAQDTANDTANLDYNPVKLIRFETISKKQWGLYTTVTNNYVGNRKMKHEFSLVFAIEKNGLQEIVRM